MRAAIICIVGLIGSWGPAMAEPLVEGQVRLPSGEPVPGARVLLFDLTDLRAAPVGATTDRSGRFTLSLDALRGSALPEGFELGTNYPNPFNPTTMIPYRLPASMHVRLEIYNLLGQRVATLVEGEQPAGFHTASWDATDAAGQAVGAGVYLYRLSGEGSTITRRMLLIDGQAGIASGGGGPSGWEGEAGAGDDGERDSVYGLTVSGPGLVPYLDPAFRGESGIGMAPLEVVLEAPGNVPSGKVASGGILGDVDNTGEVDFFDALLVALYSHDPTTVMPNNGDISLGDVNADGRVDLADAWLIAAWLNDPSDPSLPAGIGEAVAAEVDLTVESASVSDKTLTPGQSFTLRATVRNAGKGRSAATTLRYYRSSNATIAASDTRVGTDNVGALSASGTSAESISLRAPSSAGTYYYGACVVSVSGESDTNNNCSRGVRVTVSRSDPDLTVVSVSVSDNTLTPGQSFTLRATVRNAGTGRSAATTLRYYLSSNATIAASDTRVGTDNVRALSASGRSAESISLRAPSSAGTYYYGACVVSVSGESDPNNNCSRGVRVTVSGDDSGSGGEAEENVPTRLTRNSASDSYPAWSPDGTQIAFASYLGDDYDYEIYVMAADGSQLTRLTRNSAQDRGPAWSPDGTQIAFASNRDGDAEIYVMAADGSQLTRLTRNSTYDWDPAWSPDGTQIAFESNRDGNFEIYVMAADGSQPTRLTRNSDWDDSSAWSPDGTQIAFVSERDGNREIYVMAADGSQLTRLTRNSVSDGSPAWSPDGTQIAFNSERDGNGEIYVMAADGSQPTRLTRNSAGDWSPAWSPDGTQIAFVSQRDGNREIYVMAVKPETGGDGGDGGAGGGDREAIPPEPKNIRVARAGSNFRVTWNSSPGATYYDVWRCNDSLFACILLSSWRKVGSRITGTSWLDTNLPTPPPGATYRLQWTVQACNTAGCSGPL